MKSLVAWALWVVAAMLVPGAASAQAGRNEPVVVDMIHSTLPLYTSEWAQLWPRSDQVDDYFGCASRVSTGDWRFTPDPKFRGRAVRWERFGDYGTSYCAALFRAADQRSRLEEVPGDIGFFVQLGQADRGAARWELWAIQTGTAPGSDYRLLAREVGSGMVERFTVLQQRCPAANVVEAEGMDISPTRYCRIESRDELLTLARDMLALPPLGVIQLEGKTR